MIEAPDGQRTPVIDASVHIFARSNKDLRDTMREPFSSRAFGLGKKAAATRKRRASS